MDENDNTMEASAYSLYVSPYLLKPLRTITQAYEDRYIRNNTYEMARQQNENQARLASKAS
ncbi:MAG: hypothetical protein RIM72_21325 [Alphaproteobacteria bacterium]